MSWIALPPVLKDLGFTCRIVPSSSRLKNILADAPVSRMSRFLWWFPLLNTRPFFFVLPSLLDLFRARPLLAFLGCGETFVVGFGDTDGRAFSVSCGKSKETPRASGPSGDVPRARDPCPFRPFRDGFEPLLEPSGAVAPGGSPINKSGSKTPKIDGCAVLQNGELYQLEDHLI